MPKTTNARVICPRCRRPRREFEVVVVQPMIEIMLGVPPTPPTGDIPSDQPCPQCQALAAWR